MVQCDLKMVKCLLNGKVALKRTQITMKNQHGETYSVEPDIIISWHFKLQDNLKNIDTENILNGDELDQFCKFVPCKTYVKKHWVNSSNNLRRE